MVPGRVGDVEHVVEHRVRAVHVAHRGHRVGELGGRRDRLDVVERLDAAAAAQDLALRLASGPPDRADHREPVELAVGQRERAGVPERVLGRDEEERHRQRVRHAVDRDLVLLHRLEQRGLRAGRRPVHLVDEEDVREHGPGPELPLAGGRAVHRRAGDVGREQVGVHCTRPKRPPIALASDLASRVLPVPGTPSTRR